MSWYTLFVIAHLFNCWIEGKVPFQTLTFLSFFLLALLPPAPPTPNPPLLLFTPSFDFFSSILYQLKHFLLVRFRMILPTPKVRKRLAVWHHFWIRLDQSIVLRIQTQHLLVARLQSFSIFWWKYFVAKNTLDMMIFMLKYPSLESLETASYLLLQFILILHLNSNTLCHLTSTIVISHTRTPLLLHLEFVWVLCNIGIICGALHIVDGSVSGGILDEEVFVLWTWCRSFVGVLFRVLCPRGQWALGTRRRTGRGM